MQYEIADIRLSLQTDFSYQESPEFDSFRLTGQDSELFPVQFISVDQPIIVEQRPSGVDFYQDEDLVLDGVHYLGIHWDHKNCHAWMTTD